MASCTLPWATSVPLAGFGSTHLPNAASGQQPGVKEGVALSAQAVEEVAPALPFAPSPGWVLANFSVGSVKQNACRTDDSQGCHGGQ